MLWEYEADKVEVLQISKDLKVARSKAMRMASPAQSLEKADRRISKA